MIKQNEKKIFSIFKYSMIKYIALFFSFLKGILNAKFLGPELLGIMGNLTLILGYCSYANLGILNSMNREYILYKDKDEKNAKTVLNTAFTSLLILALVFLVLSIGVLFIYHNTYGVYIAFIFIIAIFEQFKNYYINYFRLKDQYNMINIIEIIYSIIAFVLTILLISKYKVYGILFSMLVCGVAIFIIGVKKSSDIKLEIDKKVLKILISIGIPLLIYNLGFYILTTIDRWIIIKYYTDVDLGYYTFANSMVSATLVFVTSILFLLYPKVIKDFNEEEGNNIIYKVNVYTRILEIASGIFFTIGIILFKPFIMLFLNQYAGSIGIYMLLLMAIITNNLAYFSNCYIVSNKKQRYLVYIQVLSIVINLIFNVFFVKMGFGVEGVAIGTLLANTIYSMIQYMIFIKLNTGEIKVLHIIKIYSRILIYSLFIIVIVTFYIDYKIYVLLLILLTIVLYIKEIKNIRLYLQIIKSS